MKQYEVIGVIITLLGAVLWGVPGKHASLGIRNVNERIKLIYGENYGLTIKPIEEGKTRSLICIPYDKASK